MLHCSIYTALEPTVSGHPQSQKSDDFKSVSLCEVKNTVFICG